MAVTICKCSAINSINLFDVGRRVYHKCDQCGVSDCYLYHCSRCYEGVGGYLATCEPCKEHDIYESVQDLQDPPKLNVTAVKKTRLPDRYSTSRWTRCSKPDAYYVHKKWKRLHDKSIEGFRYIKYNLF